MSLVARFHVFLDSFNVLKNPTIRIRDYLKERPTLYKIVLLANHIFRAAMMAAFMLLLPFSPLINGGLCLAGALFYRLTVETNCAYKFALPSWAGGMALLQARQIIPFAFTAYAVYIGLTVSYDADHS